MDHFLYPVIAVGTINFLEALAQNAVGAMNNLYGLPRQGSQRFFIRAIECATMENFGPEFNFFGSAAGFTTNPDTDTFIARYGFVDAMGERMGGAGLYRYYVDGLAIPYFDLDAANSAEINPLLHVKLQNISATGKSANAAGAIAATFWVSPMQTVQG